MLFRLFLLLLLGVSLSAESKEKNVYVYNCSDNYSFVAEASDEAAWLFLPSKTLKTKRLQSDSDVKYGADDVMYWSKGEEAILEVGKKQYNCQNDDIAATFEKAKLNGVAFRAVGNEPGWVLEITSDKEVLFITNYGEVKTHFKVVERASQYKATEYKMQSNTNLLYVRIENRVCHDTMVDRSYESTVYINFDGVNMQGCGRALY